MPFEAITTIRTNRETAPARALFSHATERARNAYAVSQADPLGSLR